MSIVLLLKFHMTLKICRRLCNVGFLGRGGGELQLNNSILHSGSRDQDKPLDRKKTSP